MAQPEKPVLPIFELVGLVTNPSTFGKNAPNGALSQAENVVIDRKSIIESRRGFDNSFSTIGTSARAQFQFDNIRLLHGSDDTLYADLLDDGVYVAFDGTFKPPSPTETGSRIRAVEANKNFYFISDEGTWRLDTISNQPRKAGAPAGLTGTGVVTGVTGFLPNLTQVAYRVVFGYRDSNNVLVLGAPSGRIIVSNNSGTAANVDVTFQIPKEIQAEPTEWFYQLYRSNYSLNLATDPDDEMKLVFEDVCAAGTTITVSDITPDVLLGEALYTNQGQGGILQSNYRAPWATDICLFKEYTFYSNTRQPQNNLLTLISAGSLNGPDALINGDTIIFTANEVLGPVFTLTGANANNAALGEFEVSNTGDPALDIQITANNIVLVANEFIDNTFLAAYYESNVNELPGKMMFERLSLTLDNFTITSSRSTCWGQVLPLTSSADVNPNYVYYSKPSQPDAVPVVNYLAIGSANRPVRRIIPLKDGVMVFKDDGVFRISNSTEPFAVTGIDSTLRIVAVNSPAVIDNKVYLLSNQGFVAVSDSDVQLMSYDIANLVRASSNPSLFPNLNETAFGIAYQTDYKYICFVPSTGADTEAKEAYIYNYLTRVWTKWIFTASCGLLFRADDRLYLGSNVGSAPDPAESYVYKERKDSINADYADNQYTATNTTVGYTNVIVIDNPDLPAGKEIEVGMTIVQSPGSANVRITGVTVGMTQTTLTVAQNQIWAAGDVVIYTPIDSIVRFVQIDCENAGMNKQFTEIVYVFTEQSFNELTVSISTNASSTPHLDYIVPTSRNGWGIDPFGEFPWGSPNSGQGKIRRYLPTKVQRAGWLYITMENKEAFTKFGLSALELFYKNTSSREKSGRA